jgi:hypothetical protein
MEARVEASNVSMEEGIEERFDMHFEDGNSSAVCGIRSE